MGGVSPGLVILGSIKKQAEQAMKSKPVNSTPPRSLHPGSHQFEFMTWLPLVNCDSGCKPNFLPKLLLVMYFITAIVTLTKT